MKSFPRFAVIVQLGAAFSLIGSAGQAQTPAKPKPVAAPAMSAAAPAIVRTPILDVPLDGLKADGAKKGFDGVEYITDIPAGLAAPRHSHPGYEFNYILKGSVSYQIDGQKPFTLKAGQGTYNKRGNIHRVWNPSKTEPAQLLAVLIKEADQPLAIPAP